MAYGLDKDFRSKSASWKSLATMLVTAAAILAAIVFAATALSAGDLLWFVTSFDERPRLILVHCAGTATAYESGSAEFERLAASVNTDLAGPKFAPPGVGLSEATQSDYWSKNLTLEVLYAQPVRMHTSFRYGLFDALIYPVSGAHSGEHLVFARRGDVVLPGVDIGDESAAAATLKGMGYTWDQFGLCSKP